MSESDISKHTPKPITLAECEICSKLEEVQTSFYTYGWNDMDQPLPDEARRLVPAEPVTSENEHRHIKQCPICGTCTVTIVGTSAMSTAAKITRNSFGCQRRSEA